MNQNNIAVAIIVRDGEGTIKDCIESFGKYVDFLSIVDTGSKDKTEEVIHQTCKKLNLQYILNHFEWIDDFSAARNYGFSFIPPEYEWVLWLDADDVVENGEKIKDLLKNTPPSINAIWLPYFYSFDDMGNCTTLFDRERILRTSAGWIWRSRLHETVAPLTQGNFARNEEISIIHKHMTEGGPRSERNFKLLNMMLKENPEDRRTWMYLGFQNFAGQHWEEACEWFLKFAEKDDVVPIEKYQCLTYSGRAFREMRKYKEAINSDLVAVGLFPDWADGYIGLSLSHVAIGDWAKAISWGETAKTKKPPDRLIFVNPLDYTYNLNVALSGAYIGTKEFQTALNCVHQALLVRPGDTSVEVRKQQILDVMSRAEAVKAVETLYTTLGQQGEWEKATKVRAILPEWLRVHPESQQLHGMVLAKYKEQIKLPISADIVTWQKEWLKDETKKYGEGMLITDLETVVDSQERLKEAEKQSDVIYIATTNIKGHKIRHFERQTLEELLVSSPSRDLLGLHGQDGQWMASYRKGKPKEKVARILCGHGLEAWQPIMMMKRGIGGSELWAAMTAKRLQELGNQTFLYGAVDGIYDGVVYRDVDKFNLDPGHIFISSRIPDIYAHNIPAECKILWFHDIHRGDRFKPEYAEGIDFVVGLSKWHVWYLKKRYPFLKSSEVIIPQDNKAMFVDDGCEGEPFYPEEKLQYPPKMVIIGNGIHTQFFKNLRVKRVEHRFIWSSSPDRSLLELLNHWPRIKKELPDATLHIFYGWEYFDTTLFIQSQREVKEKLQKLLDQPGVKWEGRIGQQQLAKEFARSQFWFYPLHYSSIEHKDGGGFRETFCITAVEAQAAGCLCVARSSGALGETVSDRGILIPRDAGDKELDYLFDLAYDKERQAELKCRGREWAMEQDWSKVGDKIMQLYEEKHGR